MLTESPTKLNIPDKTLALTYDDGPGGFTIEIARFLAELHIPATFFLIGRLIQSHPNAIEQLIELGHGIANHTFTHPDLTAEPQANFHWEFLETHRLIAKYIGDGPFFFRPPYGHWSPEVAKNINACPDAANYTGPILWDFDERDWHVGQWNGWRKWTAERCGNAYLAQIRKRQKGIVLLHSSCGIADESPKTLRLNANRYEVTRWLVPRLKDDGFAFRRIDQLL